MLYLDNAATTPLSPAMKKYITSILDDFGNPSSKYDIGVKSRRIIESARESIAKFVNTDVDNIYFTSGGSASNTLGTKGYIAKNRCDLLYSPIAHKSIINCIDSCDGRKTPMPIQSDGTVDIIELESLCSGLDSPLVIIDYVNSETGVIQDIKSIVDITHRNNGVVYVDCTASIGSVPLDLDLLDIDMCGFSGHKIGALKGVGVFYKKKNISVCPIIYGAQEGGIIGGTENVLGIASLGYAVSNFKYNKSTTQRDTIYEYILKNIPDSYLIGSLSNRVYNNLYICFKGIDSESLMLLLDLNDIQVSNGSACNSAELKPSYVLEALKIPKSDIFSCIRITFSGDETTQDLNFVCKKLKFCIEQLRSMK